MSEAQIRLIVAQEIDQRLAAFIGSDRYHFFKHLELAPGRNLILSKTSGTKIGTESTQLLGFYGATPVDRPSLISDPSGGATQDSQARTAIIALIDQQQELGLMATS